MPAQTPPARRGTGWPRCGSWRPVCSRPRLTACCCLTPTPSASDRACCRNCAPVRPPSRPSGWRMTCCSSAARPCLGRPRRWARACQRCAGSTAWPACRRWTMTTPVSAALTRPGWRRPASGWRQPRKSGRQWPAVTWRACPACPSNLRWWPTHWPGSIPMAVCWAGRCRWPQPTPPPPAPSRRPNWRWRWPPRCCFSTPRSMTVTLNTPRARTGCSAWPSASTRCARRVTPARWSCGWRSCTAACRTARPWAAWCRSCGRPCPRLSRRLTSTSAARRSARC